MKFKGKPDLSFLNAGTCDQGGSAKVVSGGGFNRSAKGLLASEPANASPSSASRGLLGRLFRR